VGSGRARRGRPSMQVQKWLEKGKRGIWFKVLWGWEVESRESFTPARASTNTKGKIVLALLLT
jgi:hypothetical protein